jgi:hypothetical protein
MASELTVQTLKAPTSGGNANKILIPSGQTVYSPGTTIQQLHQTITAYTSTSATSLTGTGFTLTITPKSTSSIIKCTVGFNGFYAAQQNTGGRLELMKNGSSIAYLDDITGYGISNQNANQGFNPTHVYFDSPSTTAATIYSISWFRNGGSGVLYFNNYITGNNRTRSWFTVEEIAQ